VGYVSDKGDQRSKEIHDRLEDLRDAINALFQAEAKEYFDTGSPDAALEWLQRRRDVLRGIEGIEKQLREASQKGVSAVRERADISAVYGSGLDTPG
jgi:hypothetical protein